MKKICVLFLILSWFSSAYPKNSITEKLDIDFQNICNQEVFSGTALISYNGKVIFKNSCGFSNRNFNIQNQIDTKFNLGSVGKIFTSIAIAQLIEKKKMKLSTPVVDFIPDWFPNRAISTESEKITVGQLLVHASGFSNYMDDPRWKLGADSAKYTNIIDYKPILLDEKLLFSPGKSQLYSNSGYLLLGAIIESVSNMKYKAYLQKNIFSALGMKNSGVYRLDEVVENRSEGYSCIKLNGKCTWRNNTFNINFMGDSAGGSYSTVEDLYALSQALRQEKLLNKAMTQELLSTQPVFVSKSVKLKKYAIGNKKIDGNFSPYGFAGSWNSFGLAIWENPNLVGHTGGIEGASALFSMSQNNDYTFIILSNTDGLGTIQLYQKFRNDLGLHGEISNY